MQDLSNQIRLFDNTHKSLQDILKDCGYDVKSQAMRDEFNTFDVSSYDIYTKSGNKNINHKIISIEVAGRRPVYSITFSDNPDKSYTIDDYQYFQVITEDRLYFEHPSSLRNKTNIHILCFDLKNSTEVYKINKIEQLEDKGVVARLKLSRKHCTYHYLLDNGVVTTEDQSDARHFFRQIRYF